MSEDKKDENDIWYICQMMCSVIPLTEENPEFSEWKWSSYNLLVENIVPFKRNTYKKILEEFKDLFKS